MTTVRVPKEGTCHVSALFSALNARSVPAVLLAVGLGVASVPRDGIDPEAIEAAAARPAPGCPPEMMGFRFPAPGDYPLQYLPWIRSREDLIAHFTRGEDPEVVRRYVEGPEEELIEYLGEVFLRAGHPAVSRGRQAAGSPGSLCRAPAAAAYRARRHHAGGTSSVAEMRPVTLAALRGRESPSLFRVLAPGAASAADTSIRHVFRMANPGRSRIRPARRGRRGDRGPGGRGWPRRIR